MHLLFYYCRQMMFGSPASHKVKLIGGGAVIGPGSVACAHTARLALRGCPRPPAAALWRTARMRAGPGRPACSVPSHRVRLRLLLTIASHHSHCVLSSATA